MTTTAYAKTEPDLTEGYLHLAMAPDGTLYGPRNDCEADPPASADIAAEQLLEAIRRLEDRMSERIDSLAVQDQRAEAVTLPPEGAAVPSDPISRKPEAAEAPQAPEAAPEPEHVSKTSSAAPYVIVSAILIAAGLTAIVVAGLYFAGVI